MSGAASVRPPSSARNSPVNGAPKNYRYSGGHGQGSGSSGGSRPPSRQGHHVDDLRVEAQRRIRELGPVLLNHLIESAASSLRTAETLLDRGRRDQAYIEYLVAYEIAVDQIPRNRGWPDLKLGRNQLYHRYRDVLIRLEANDERFRKVKEAIEEEDHRTAEPSRSRPSSMTSRSTPPPSRGSQDRPVDEDGWEHVASVSRDPRSDDISSSGARLSNNTASYSGRSTPVSSTPPRSKPPLRPKPDALHGNSLHPERVAANDGTAQDLAERFARLRGPSATLTDSTKHTSPTSLSGYEPLGMTGQAPPPSRPSGPRDMPPPSSGSKQPLSLPIDTLAAISMPKAPTPAYSPARNMQTPAGVNPPRTSARSTIGTGGRSNSIASSISSKPPGPDGDSDSYFPRANGRVRDDSRRRGSIGLPSSDKSIKADVLYDCLNMYSVLLIDVRPREVFDRGHIDHSSILCIEPLTLRQSMSAEELQNALVLSPDVEQILYDRRDEFDLVVYYDSSTDHTSFLTSPDRDAQEDVLRTLFDALWEFNTERPLKKHPMLLVGGLRAWEALLGRPALATSETAATKAWKERKPPKKLVSPPSASAQLAIEKKRRREFNPIDADELRKWEERARQESLPLELPPAAEEEAEEEEGEEEEEEIDIDEDDGDGEGGFYRTQEDFLRRYPAISVEQESMIEPLRHDLYPRVRTQQQVNYPTTKAIPELPSRPPPAAPRVSYSGAHERSVAPFNNQARTSSLRPYVPSKDMPENIRLPKTGLINFGVTCYMNATIQCLNATIPLTQLFRDGTYRKFIQRENWKGSKGLLPENYANLVNHLWKGDVMACRPTTFRNFCARLNGEWALDRQQDAKEFFDFVLDFLHEDLNINWRNPPAHVLSPAEEEIRERMHKGFASLIEWTRYQKRDKSIISDLFAGQHASRLRCLVCNHTSTTYEAFYSISVEIPREGVGDIYDCLASYCREERLSAEERWKCPSCKKECEATKQITITRAPRYLVVHFKRFRASHRESARKVSTPINFPLTNLDIGPFMLTAPSMDDAEDTYRVTGDNKWRAIVAEKRLDDSMTGPFRYDAYAVIRHLGASVASGHYIAVAKDPGRHVWRVFNDDRVQDFDPAHVAPAQRLQNEQAYIVFYQRIGALQD